MKDFFELEACVEQWAIDKGIMLNGNPMKQALKTQEEVTELLTAIFDNDKDEIEDAIGDIIVTLIIQAKMQNTSIEACLNGAYGIISKRTGNMVNGQFVKDGR